MRSTNPITEQPKNYNFPINPDDYIKELKDIGTKPEDFEPIPSDGKYYTVLGKGNFGFAEKVKSKLNNKIYAIKKLAVKDLKIKDFIRETTFMTQLSHDHIMKLHGYFQGVENINKLKEIYINDKKGKYQNENEDVVMFFLVMDCMENGSLETYCKKRHNENKMVEQVFIMKIFEQLLKALIYLEEKQLMHRDIKLDNILLDKNYNAKISDFGISAVYNKNTDINRNDVILSNFTTVGRIDFVAPEIMDKEKYDYRVDIYGLGLTMLCLMSKRNPIEIDENRKRTINTDLIYEGYNKYLKILVLTMILHQDLRPRVKDVLNYLEMIQFNIQNPNNELALKTLDDTIKEIIDLYQKSQIRKQNQNSHFQQGINNPFFIPQTIPSNQMSSPLPSHQGINPGVNNNNIISGIQQPSMMPVQNMNLSADQINIIGYSIKSLLCVLKCLYFCFRENLDYLISALYNSNFNQSMTLYILNGIKFMEKDYDINYLYVEVNNFKMNLATNINILSANFSVRPNEIYENLIYGMKDETKNFNFNFNNNMNFYQNMNLNLNLNNFPNVYNMINNFFNEKKNPFVYYFYFLIFELDKCPKCSNILKANVYQNDDLKLPGIFTGNISALINVYFQEHWIDFNTCGQCGMNCKSSQKYYLLTLPQFFIVSLVGKEMAIKNIDYNIDLRNYLYPGIQMNAFYDLFAYIYKENNEYCAVIYQSNGWFFYNTINLQQVNSVNVNGIYPYFVIYKLRN